MSARVSRASGASSAMRTSPEKANTAPHASKSASASARIRSSVFPQADAELAQLLLMHRTRRMHQHVLRALRLRKGDNVADRFRAGHQRHQAVEAEGDAAVRRCAVWQVVEKEAELRSRFLVRDAERLEYLGLHVGAMDTYRPTANLPAVQYHVVGLGNRPAGVGADQLLVAVARRGKRMVHRRPAPTFLVPLEHREVEHPQRAPLLGDEPFVLADLHAQGTQRRVDDAGLIRAEEHRVAVLRARTLDDLTQNVGR